jgi:hypothetical protein
MSLSAKAAPSGRIEISLRNIGQLFNSLDPSPFLEKDLDHDAEEFLVGWAREHPHGRSLELVLHLQEWPERPDAEANVRDAVHNYFSYRARIGWQELRQLLRRGRVSLLIGLTFLSGCLLLSEYLALRSHGHLAEIVRESLTIGGWVAMWQPMQIYLYGWWPIRALIRVHERMSRMDVRLRRIGPGSKESLRHVESLRAAGAM